MPGQPRRCNHTCEQPIKDALDLELEPKKDRVFCAARRVMSLNQTMRHVQLPDLRHPDYTFLYVAGSLPAHCSGSAGNAGPYGPGPYGGMGGGMYGSGSFGGYGMGGGMGGGMYGSASFGGPGMGGGMYGSGSFGGYGMGGGMGGSGSFGGYGMGGGMYGSGSFGGYGMGGGMYGPGPYGPRRPNNGQDIDCSGYTFPGMTDDQILDDAKQAIDDARNYMNMTWNQKVDDVMTCVKQLTQSLLPPGQYSPDEQTVVDAYKRMANDIKDTIRDMNMAVMLGESNYIRLQTTIFIPSSFVFIKDSFINFNSCSIHV